MLRIGGSPLQLALGVSARLVPTILLLLVVLPGTPDTVIAAQRITRWAMFACAILGVACFAAPRGLDVSSPATNERSTGRRKGGASGGGVAPPAGSRSAA